MSWTNHIGVGDRRDWILRFLYAPVEGSHEGEIQGRTRLMKGAFLLAERLESEFEKETDFEFQADKYGPFDQKVYEATEELQEEGLLRIIERPDEQGGDIYRLTEQGRDKAKSLYKDVSEDEQQLMSWLKGKHLNRPLSEILSFVYNQYPNMAKNSQWK